MCEYGFSENGDYFSFAEKSAKPTGGRPSTNHIIKLDMAKHIAMIQRTLEGFTIRQKLIELEKNQTALAPQDYASALRALADEIEKEVALEAEKKQLEAELDRSKEWYSIKRVAATNGVSWKTFNWRKLKLASENIGKGARKIFDANYGEVNVYHMDAWEKVYPDYEL